MGRVITRTGAWAAAGVVGAALAVTPAAAAPTWQPVTNLFTDVSAAGGSAHTPVVEVDAEGTATALWSRSDGTQMVVQASTRPAGGSWSRPVDVAAGRSIFDPRLAIDPAGNATAVWRRVDVGGSVVQSASRPAGGTWSAPVDVSSDPAVDLSAKPDFPQVAVDASGTVTASWSRYDGTARTVQAASRPLGGSWTAPADLSVPGPGARPTEVAVAATGEATVLWTTATAVQAVTRPAGGTWSTPADLASGTGPALNPRAVVDPYGTTTAVWSLFTGGGYVVQSATKPDDGPWTTAQTVSTPGKDAFDSPQVAVDDEGDVVALWQENDGSGWVVTAATRPEGRAWDPPHAISAGGEDAWTPQVAVGPGGNPVAVWAQVEGKARVVRAARLFRAGWSTPIDLSRAAGEAWNPDVAVDAAGNATTAWSRRDGGGWIVQTRGLDASGPVVSDISSRATRRGTTYRVTADDVWSRVRTTTWTFADGTTATGRSVTHRGRGRGAVRVTLTDRVGNATTCTYRRTFRCARGTAVPAITQARLDPGTIRSSRGPGRVPTSTELVLELSANARVRAVVRPRGAGTDARFITDMRAGTDSLTITARLGRHQVLPPGRYTVIVTATNKAGTSTATRLPLRVVR